LSASTRQLLNNASAPWCILHLTACSSRLTDYFIVKCAKEFSPSSRRSA